MNDEFLKSYRRLPDAEFLERLQARLRRRERLAGAGKSILLTCLAAVLVLGISMIALPSVRADILSLIWNETSDMPVLYLTWAGANRIFTLQIYHMVQVEDFQQMVGPGALEEVMVGGRPAAVVRGAWNVDTQEYDINGMISLSWKYDDETIYSLSGVEPMMPLETLIRIAESIP
jgi:hypothetical protein